MTLDIALPGVLSTYPVAGEQVYLLGLYPV